MSHIIPFTITAPGEPRLSHALPERLIDGNPQYKTWEMDSVDGDRIRAGLWEATPGTTLSIKGSTWEFCVILSGLVEITEDGGPSHRFQAGDSFTLRPGFVGQWKTIETVRKLWVIVSNPAA